MKMRVEYKYNKGYFGLLTNTIRCSL